MKLALLENLFSVCQTEDFSCLSSLPGLFFAAYTGREYSLVCETAHVPAKTLRHQDGWRAFQVAGQLDFSLVGVLAGLSAVLKNAGVSIFAVSTYDTDYLLVRDFQLKTAQTALEDAGYLFIHDVP